MDILEKRTARGGADARRASEPVRSKNGPESLAFGSVNEPIRPSKQIAALRDLAVLTSATRRLPSVTAGAGGWYAVVWHGKDHDGVD